jgi:ATP-dependent Clp protease, protease subunit
MRYTPMEEKMVWTLPQVIEQSGNTERFYDIYSRLLKDRIIFIDGEINDVSADIVAAQLLFLDSQDPEKDISLYINSPGGSVTAGLAVYDTIQSIRSDVQTFCLGQAASMAALILTCGTKGKRFALPSSRVLIHQPWGGVSGQASDVSLQAKEILRLKKLTIDYFAEASGKDPSVVAADMERDFFMSAAEAMEYGLVDRILERRKHGEAKAK